MLINEKMLGKFYINSYEKNILKITEQALDNDASPVLLEHEISNNCFLSYQEINTNNSCKSLTTLSIDYLKTIKDIDILLIGTGNKQCFPDKNLYSQVKTLSYSIDFMENHAACRTFNILINENRKVASLFFIG